MAFLNILYMAKSANNIIIPAGKGQYTHLFHHFHHMKPLSQAKIHLELVSGLKRKKEDHPRLIRLESHRKNGISPRKGPLLPPHKHHLCTIAPPILRPGFLVARIAHQLDDHAILSRRADLQQHLGQPDAEDGGFEGLGVQVLG